MFLYLCICKQLRTRFSSPENKSNSFRDTEFRIKWESAHSTHSYNDASLKKAILPHDQGKTSKQGKSMQLLVSKYACILP